MLQQGKEVPLGTSSSSANTADEDILAQVAGHSAHVGRDSCGRMLDFREEMLMLRRQEATVSDVTLEARKVLDQFLKRSLSHNDASPYQREHLQLQALNISEMSTIEEEHMHGCLHLKPPSFHRKTASETSMPEDSELQIEESDYVQLHELVGKAQVVYPESGLNVRSSGISSQSLSQGSSDQTKLSVHPFEDIKLKHKTKKKTQFVESLSNPDHESSSSTEDYELVDNELLMRKKKSFFRWASERVRESFRRKKEAQAAAESDVESPRDENPPEIGAVASAGMKPKKKKKNKLKLQLVSLKRSGSEKSKSSSTPNEAMAQTKVCREPLLIPACPELLEECEESTDEQRRKKSPVPWKNWEVKVKKDKDKEGLFESILIKLRRGGSKLKRKGSKERQRSRSADNLVIRPLSKEHEKLLRRFVDQTQQRSETEYDNDSDNHTVRSFHEVSAHKVQAPPSPLTQYNSPLLREGHHALRQKMHLEGLIPCQQAPQQGGSCDHPSLEHDYVEMDSVDEDEYNTMKKMIESDAGDVTDGLRSAICLSYNQKPFHERTNTEKEEIYEKIAERLAQIGDQYNLESPKSSSSPTSNDVHTSESEDICAKAIKPLKQKKPKVPAVAVIEKQLGNILRQKGDAATKNMPDPTPLVAELVQNASYSKFKQIVNENIGNDLGWQQIAMMFRLTQTAVQMAGMGTAVALQIKEHTLQYFEDKFASWVVGLGGWESMVEDTNTESELD